MQIPPIILGYEKNPLAGPMENAILIGIDPAGETLLNLFITLEPPLVQPAPLHLKVHFPLILFHGIRIIKTTILLFPAKFISEESDRFLRYASRWNASFSRFPNRPIISTTLDITGHTTFIW